MMSIEEQDIWVSETVREEGLEGFLIGYTDLNSLQDGNIKEAALAAYKAICDFQKLLPVLTDE